MTYYRAPQRQSSMTTWVSVGILVVTCVIGLVIFGAVLSQSHGRQGHHSHASTPSSTVPAISCPQGFVSPHANPDCYFLYMIKKRGIGSPDGDAGLIRQAHEICALMDQAAAAGRTPSVAALPLIHRQHPEFSIGDAAYFGSITMEAYCPWNVRQ
jgi:hypothetical protein